MQECLLCFPARDDDGHGASRALLFPASASGGVPSADFTSPSSRLQSFPPFSSSASLPSASGGVPSADLTSPSSRESPGWLQNWGLTTPSPACTPLVRVFFPPLPVCVSLSHLSISRSAQALQPIAIFGAHSVHRLLVVKVTLPFQAFALFFPVHVNWCLSLLPLTFCTGTTFFSNGGRKNCRALG